MAPPPISWILKTSQQRAAVATRAAMKVVTNAHTTRPVQGSILFA
jgi:hypothetical protein